VVFPDAPPVRLYADWPYVLIDAGPEQALALRSHATTWKRSLPDLLFPADHSWLLSTLWDDDWRCLGGPVSLVEASSKSHNSTYAGYPSTRMQHHRATSRHDLAARSTRSLAERARTAACPCAGYRLACQDWTLPKRGTPLTAIGSVRPSARHTSRTA
jgi:hypothetical protein